MEFKLRWENPNKFDTVVRIYRGTSALSFATLANPIATLSNGETEWSDTNLTYGLTYFYMLTVTANGQTIPTLNQTFKAVNRRGIGSELVQVGDDRFGFMGAVPFDETMEYSDLLANLITITGMTFGSRPALLKWIRNGKIFYTLTTLRFTNDARINWDTLYQSGMVYGTDDAGPEGRRGTNPPVVQDAGMIHKGDRYRVRLMRGITGDNGEGMIDLAALGGIVNHDNLPNTPDCEFNDLAYQFQPFFPEKSRHMHFIAAVSNPDSNYITQSGASYVNMGWVCQERDIGDNGLVLCRANSQGAGATLDATHCAAVNPRAANTMNWWAPIIELVEE